MKLDRSVGSSYHFDKQPEDSAYQKKYTSQELADVFFHLQCIAYNMSDYPRMDKTVYSHR